MPSYLRLSVLFLDPVPTFHGCGDAGLPEWPPSPIRLYQALLAAVAAHLQHQDSANPIIAAFKWLENRIPSIIVAPAHRVGSSFRIAVPNNDLDAPAYFWTKGMEAPKPRRPIDLKTMKSICPIRISPNFEGWAFIYYLYELTGESCEHAKILDEACRAITHLGRGVDLVTANASVVSAEDALTLRGVRWYVEPNGSSQLRTPRSGTLKALSMRHKAFLNRVDRGGFNPVPPLSDFNIFCYQPACDPISNPSVVFELLNDDDTRFSYAQDKLVHIAAMVRHLAIELMKTSPPEGVPDDWVETYVAGHAKPSEIDHRQFSYLPLPSIGHAHTDPAVRRVMLAAPAGDDRLLNHLAKYLSGQRLKPTPKTQMKNPPTLVQIRGDGVSTRYTTKSNVWASVTPIILPGHDDHKPEKTRRLILKALQQARIDQPCEFEWYAFSNFAKSLSAHKYDRNKRPIGYIRPEHLLNLSATHLTIRFEDNRQVPGPIAIGAGRHCGLGIFAALDGRKP